jgi:hypothetical protein
MYGIPYHKTGKKNISRRVSNAMGAKTVTLKYEK